jgi:DNA-binding response OmpR family regulator
MNEQSPARILIVDDEPYIASLIQRYLITEGYTCAKAASGEEALQELHREEYDLVLSDIIMPKMSGIDLLNIVRTLYPSIPVIMVTAVNDRDTGVLALELGALGYIVKPFEREELLSSIAGALHRKKLLAAGKGIQAGKVQRPKRKPIKISAKQVLAMMKNGADEAAIMQEFNLSAKAYSSLSDQLRAAGLMEWQEYEIRRSLTQDSVIVDSPAPVADPLPVREKAKISAAEASKAIRSGLGDSALMKKFGISAKGLRSLFRKLVVLGVIDQAELDKRMVESHDWAIVEDETFED